MPSAVDGLRRAKIRFDILRTVRPGVECFVCGNRLWFWKIPRSDGAHEVRCWRCGTMQRQRRTLLFLRRQTNLYGTDRVLRVLHVAPDERVQKELLALPNVDVLTGDLLDESVDIRLDLTAIDLPDETFDAIICSHVLEHVPDDRKAIREMRRVLKSDGWALINVPSDPNLTESYENGSLTTPEERLAAFGQEDHVRIYASTDFAARLESGGFRVTVDPLEATRDERRRFILDGDGGGEHAYLAVPA